MLTGLSLLASLSVFAAQTTGGEPGDLEETVCGAIKEPFVFAVWSLAAGRPRPDAAATVAGATVEAFSHRTRDGRTLRGYRLRADRPVAPRGFILVAQGNAMLADQLLDALAPFTSALHVVHVLDFRGYGNSEGRRRLKAIVSDYREIFAALRADYPGEALLYGISFGGIVLSNVIGAGARFDRAVIDSSPSRLSPYGCPERYDPVNNLPPDASRMLIVRGEKDRVVPAADSRELAEVARLRGAQVVTSPDFGHPFMDTDAAIHARRQNLIRSFLLDGAR
ncbi:MAG TPA: alpha/beta hydrolase [Burkholderiales bacterium]|nr:alpha/beta hydrolase [Burkholderiales bacterium]